MAAVTSSEECKLESDYTQELPGSRTSSLTFITDDACRIGVGPLHRRSSDASQSLLNGSQPNSFVCGGAPAAPHADDSLPSGALVNGSGSHRASEKPHVLTADASLSPRTDASPEVLEPPSELQSNTYWNPEEHPVQHTLSGAHKTDLNDGPIERQQVSHGVEERSVWDVDSESSSDSYEGLNRNLREKFMCLLLNGGILDKATKRKMEVEGLRSACLSRRKRKTSPKNGKTDLEPGENREAREEKVLENLEAHTNMHQWEDEAEIQVDGRMAPLKRRLETRLALNLYQGTECDSNTEEEKPSDGNLIHYLDHDEEQESESRTFICKECGRWFCERSSLLKHTQIHQEQRERLMEEIKGLNERRDRVYSSTSTHENQTNSDCDAVSEQEMEDHQGSTHLNILRSSSACPICTFTSKSRSILRKHMQLVHGRANQEMHNTRLAPESCVFHTENQLEEPISEWSNCIVDLCPGDNGAQTHWKRLRSDSAEKLNFTGLANVYKDNQEPEEYGNHVRVAHLQDDADNCTKDSSAGVQIPTLKSPSKRKMSIPFHNTGLALLKHELEEVSIQEPIQSSSCNLLNSNQVQGFKVEFHTEPADLGTLEDDDEIHTIVVKEENIESALTQPDPDYSYCYRAVPAFEMEPKRCPYCPAAFDSGVGLSNHIRGHLHRLGLSYEARHMLSPEQVASQDRQPRLRRRAHALHRYIRRAGNPVSEPEHTCPLCLGWFDTKTGLSNHVRGHLKRIGKPTSGISKSPLCILTELLQDQNQHENVLQALEPKARPSRTFISRKIARSERLFLTSSRAPAKAQRSSNQEEELPEDTDMNSRSEETHQKSWTSIMEEELSEDTDTNSRREENHQKSWTSIMEEELSEDTDWNSRREEIHQKSWLSNMEEELPEDSDRNSRREEIHQESWTSNREQELSEMREGSSRREETDQKSSSNSVLVHLLKRRRTEQEPGHMVPSKARFMIPPCRKVPPDVLSEQRERLEPNKRTCVHCNATFHSGVSLSNHLRAYERRKRIALQEGTSFECSQRSPRSRAAPKIKHFQTPPTTTEVIYTLTCRFCDLVFEGPQYVQEDWVKHLQRHLMHTTVSGCSVPMVEIPAVPTVCEGLDHVTQGL